MSSCDSVDRAMQDWVDAWSARDRDAVLALWDHADEDAMYLPAERHKPLTGADAVKSYVHGLCDAFPTIRHRPTSLVIKPLSDTISLVFYVLEWAVADKRGPIGGRCRVTAVWRKRDDGWKLTQYSEAPVAPLVELKEFYQHVAAEGLPP